MRHNPTVQTVERFSTRLLLAPAHEVLAKDELWHSLQELNVPVTAANVPNTQAGVGLVLGVDPRGEPYVERVVEKSPAMRCGMIEQYDVLYSIDGFVVSGRKAEYISNLLTGNDKSVCQLVLLRGVERESVKVSLERALPAGVSQRPTIKEVAMQFGGMERKRLSELTHFIQNFGTWHREVNKWLQSTIRGLHSEGHSPALGKLNVSASRGHLLDAIRIESLCETMVQSRHRKYLFYLMDIWTFWAFRRRRLHLLSNRLIALTSRTCQRSFLWRFYENATYRRLYRRQVSKSIAYGRLVHKKFGFAGLVTHQQQVFLCGCRV